MSDVNLYIQDNIKNISNENVYVRQDKSGIPEKKLNSAIKTLKCESYLDKIIALYDNTPLWSLSFRGLVFTGERLLYSSDEYKCEILYSEITEIEYKKDVLIDNSNKETIKHRIIIKTNTENHTLEQLGKFNYIEFEKLLKHINHNFDEYQDVNMMITIAEMPEELKISYMKIIINMTYSNDAMIDEQELAEIFLLMTRLELSNDSRFELRRYMSTIDNDMENNIELVSVMKKYTKPIQMQSIKISLAKDLINIYLATNNDENCKNFDFLIQNKKLFELNDKEVSFALEVVQKDNEMLKKDISDSAIKKNIEDLSANAAAIGVPLAAVYMSGSIIGMSASGIASGLATLGMGGILGFSSMATGIGTAIILGVITYKGVRHITGANELEKFKRREIILIEVIKQTQKTITLVINDINFIANKLNEAIINHGEQNEKIAKLMTMLTKFQAALKNIDNKTNQCENSIAKLKCPITLDIARIQYLASDPTKKPLFDFIVSSYTDKFELKSDIATDRLEKLASAFQALEYFNVDNIIKSKVSDGFSKLKEVIS